MKSSLFKWQSFFVLFLALLLAKTLLYTGQNNYQPQITAPKYPFIQTPHTQKTLYDQAFQKAKKYFTPSTPVRGAVIAANLKDKEELAGFFQRIQDQNYHTIVVLSTNNLPDGNPITTAKFAYKTLYGTLQPPDNILDAHDESFAKAEPWPAIFAPFVAKNFPHAFYLPIFINEKATAKDIEKFAVWLDNNLPQNSLVLAQTTSKTSSEPTVAEFQLKFTENVLENFDHEKFSSLPLANTLTIDVLQKYLALRHAQHVQNQFSDSNTGAFLSYLQDGPMYQNRNIFMVAFGDIMLDRLVRTLIDANGLDYPFQKMDKTYLQSNDILVANLEGPIAKKRISTSKSIAFRFAPDIVPLLEKYFFDALSEANNHARDMGDPGFNDTFDLLAPTAIKVFGDPREVNDRSVATLKVQEQNVVFLGLEEVVYKIDDEKAVAKIKELNKQGYKVIPFLHWGIEYRHKPNTRQRELAHKFIDAGAIAVIGCHPHVVQTYETYKNRPIFYSLGNAIFDQYFSPDTQEGLSVALIVSNDQIEVYFLPIRLDRSQFRLMTAEEKTSFLKRFETYGEYPTEAEKQAILSGKLTIKLDEKH